MIVSYAFTVSHTCTVHARTHALCTCTRRYWTWINAVLIFLSVALFFPFLWLYGLVWPVSGAAYRTPYMICSMPQYMIHSTVHDPQPAVLRTHADGSPGNRTLAHGLVLQSAMEPEVQRGQLVDTTSACISTSALALLASHNTACVR